eukprot:850164-Pleurochrysis_carterae.AAC.3
MQRDVRRAKRWAVKIIIAAAPALAAATSAATFAATSAAISAAISAAATSSGEERDERKQQPRAVEAVVSRERPQDELIRRRCVRGCMQRHARARRPPRSAKRREEQDHAEEQPCAYACAPSGWIRVRHSGQRQ